MNGRLNWQEGKQAASWNNNNFNTFKKNNNVNAYSYTN